jgi:hypothetical protein
VQLADRRSVDVMEVPFHERRFKKGGQKNKDERLVECDELLHKKKRS